MSAKEEVKLFVAKHGNEWFEPISEFMKLCPDFPESQELAKKIGVLTADIHNILVMVWRE